MIATLLVWTTLHFTTPANDADPACAVTTPSATPPAEVALVSTSGDTLARHPAAPLGAPDSIAFDWPGQPITVFLISRKPQSPWSCPSNPVTLGSTTSVPLDWPTSPSPRRNRPCGGGSEPLAAVLLMLLVPRRRGGASRTSCESDSGSYRTSGPDDRA